MLFAVVHANGSYLAHTGENMPPVGVPEDYYRRLSAAAVKHVNSGQPFVYLPYWVNAHDTRIFSDQEAQQKALGLDPVLAALPQEIKESVEVLFDGPPYRMDARVARQREERMCELISQEGSVLFAGAYMRACVRSTALLYVDAVPTADVFIDPTLSVDIDGDYTSPIHDVASAYLLG